MKICLLCVLLTNLLAVQADLPKNGRTYIYINLFREYKQDFNKRYTRAAQDYSAQINFVYNKQLIELHNFQFNRGLQTYFLRENQFTDRRLVTFNRNFPLATQLTQSFDSPLPNVTTVAPAELNLTTTDFIPMDQGLNCNAGWAYAAVSAIQILQNSTDEFSAQGLIDCAGGARACRNQVPQTAFDYLTRFAQNLYLESEYPNDINATESAMCIAPSNPTNTAKLSQYGRLEDGDDDSLMLYVGAGYPVIVEFNPTSFGFMHYGGGVFRQTATSRGSHFMVVVGYGIDAATGLNYWSLLNSFGTEWGENGIMRVERVASKPITKNAILPLLNE